MTFEIAVLEALKRDGRFCRYIGMNTIVLPTKEIYLDWLQSVIPDVRCRVYSPILKDKRFTNSRIGFMDGFEFFIGYWDMPETKAGVV